MTDLASLQSKLAALKKVRDSGVLTLRHGETATTFRNLDEIERAIVAVEAEIAAAQGQKRKRVTYIYQSGKGL